VEPSDPINNLLARARAACTSPSIEEGHPAEALQLFAVAESEELKPVPLTDQLASIEGVRPVTGDATCLGLTRLMLAGLRYQAADRVLTEAGEGPESPHLDWDRMTDEYANALKELEEAARSLGRSVPAPLAQLRDHERSITGHGDVLYHFRDNEQWDVSIRAENRDIGPATNSPLPVPWEVYLDALLLRASGWKEVGSDGK